MGVGFITYAKMTSEFQAMSRPERAAAMERLKEQASENNVHMLMWGHPYGVNENLVIVPVRKGSRELQQHGHRRPECLRQLAYDSNGTGVLRARPFFPARVRCASAPHICVTLKR